jgi:RND family efflux transporter, MFP subunit
MKKGIIGIAIVGMVLSSCGNAKKDKEGDINDKKAQLEKLKKEQKDIATKITTLETDLAKSDTAFAKKDNAKLVAITPVQTGSFIHYIDLEGKITSSNISFVSPPNGTGGIVKELLVTQGQFVKKGQVLARLDDQLIKQQIEPLKVLLASDEDFYRRSKNLWDQGIGTYQQVQNAKTQMDNRQKLIEGIQKQVNLMTVTAPVSGIADQVNVRVGEAFTGVNALGPQITIVNTSDLKVTVQIPENYMSRVNVGNALEIILPDQNNRVITATINVASKVIDQNTRSFYVEARIPSSSNLKPNQVAKVRIKDYGNPNAITIPVNTLQNDETGKYVMVAVTENGKLVTRKKTVTIGELYGDHLELKSGLQVGDQLITEGFQGLYDGQVITTQAK